MADFPPIPETHRRQITKDLEARAREKAKAKAKPNGEAKEPPKKSMAEVLKGLTGKAWQDMQLPPRDWAIEGLLCTTSRWMIIGASGAGKTLFGLSLANALANGKGFLNWLAARSMRVLYLDGELPGETCKERVQAANAIFDGSENLLVISRDVIPEDWMQPLNKPEGEKWLDDVIAAWKPDVIIFDSIMCLTALDLKKPEEWAPVRLLMRKLTAKRIAQIWMHHTGFDESHSYGDKTKEWDLDTTLLLTEPEGEDNTGRIVMRFRKQRLRTPDNAHLFASLTIRQLESHWQVEGAAPKEQANARSQVDRQADDFLRAYSDLSAGVTPEPGHTRKLVCKVRIEDIKARMIERHELQEAENQTERNAQKQAFHKAKTRAKERHGMVMEGKLTWRD